MAKGSDPIRLRRDQREEEEKGGPEFLLPSTPIRRANLSLGGPHQ